MAQYAAVEERKIAVIGGGPGGLSAGLALHRAGIPCVVFERRDAAQIAGEGAFLTLAPNGMRVLQELGVAKNVIAAGLLMNGLDIRNERGAQLLTVDYSDHEARYGAPSVTITRGRLNTILLDACRADGVEVRLSTQVEAVENGEDGVVVSVGGTDERFSAAIACDGLRSRVRSRLFPELPPPRYSGLVGTGGMVEAPDVPATQGMMRMVFGRNAFFGYMKDDGGPVYWFNNYAASGLGPVDQPHIYALQLRAMHADDPPEVRQICDSIRQVTQDYPIHDMDPLESWHKQRVLLAGDAAHAVAPHSGQGASMALEDGVMLANCLVEAQGIDAAFELFEARRMSRAGRAMVLGRLSGSQKAAKGWLSRRMRDLILPLVMPMAVRKQAELFPGP